MRAFLLAAGSISLGMLQQDVTQLDVLNQNKLIVKTQKSKILVPGELLPPED